MPDFDNGQDWVDFFEEKFPRGILATFAKGEHELAYLDDSPQTLAVRVGYEGDRLFLVNYFTGHPQFFTPLDFITEDPEHMVIEVDENKYLILSSKVSDSQATAVMKRKEGGIFS